MHSYGVRIYLYTYTNYFEKHLHALKTNTYAYECNVILSERV